MRVLIVPDKFKGTLTATEAASAIARGWSRVRPDDVLELLPMSDGGDGFGTVLMDLIGATRRRVNTVDAAHRPCRAQWAWEPQTRTAIVESAEVIGLARLPAGRFHPFELDTAGLGKVLTAVARLAPHRVFIGIGGSATNDGGFGLARALGWQFLTRSGLEIRSWPELASCQRIIPPEHRPALGRVVVAVDVQNPLLGPTGCTRIYGPQKGLRTGEFRHAERALAQVTKVLGRQQFRSAQAVAGSGAAGGLGYGLLIFVNAVPMPGFALFAREADLTRRIRAADLVITGEGCMDQQSLMGKGVGELLARCERLGVPCIGVSGIEKFPGPARIRFAHIYSLTSMAGHTEAVRHAKRWLTRAASQAAADWNASAQ